MRVAEDRRVRARKAVNGGQMADGRWATGDGRWATGDGRRATGRTASTSSVYAATYLPTYQ